MFQKAKKWNWLAFKYRVKSTGAPHSQAVLIID
jgi:hypothetical protein